MRGWFVGWCVLCVGCGPSTEGSNAAGDGTGGEASSSDSDSGDGSPMQWPAPDCATLTLPGNPDDVAATPRPDRDAEVLALQIEPALFVARQDRYDVIAADLAAIREADSNLADVHIECDLPRGYEFWVWGEFDYEFMDAIFRGVYEAWDCHNDFYGVEYAFSGPTDVWLLDGTGFAMRLDGVYASAIAELYLDLPGFDRLDAIPFWEEGPSPSDNTCETNAGRITLEATEDENGALVERTYTMEHPLHGASTWVATGSGPPTPAG